jgi:hypothetical protein
VGKSARDIHAIALALMHGGSTHPADAALGGPLLCGSGGKTLAGAGTRIQDSNIKSVMLYQLNFDCFKQNYMYLYFILVSLIPMFTLYK